MISRKPSLLTASAPSLLARTRTSSDRRNLETDLVDSDAAIGTIKINMAVAMVNGDGDKAANSSVDRDIDVLKKHKCKALKFEFTGGHVVGPTGVLLDTKKWIVEERKSPALLAS